ncbi:MAG: potassium channel family protein [Chloroflexi bacterium]|nr:potassium channel family protein [Chloroflexota bacterium]
MNNFLKSALNWMRHRATRSFILKLVIVLLVILIGSGIGVYYLEHDSVAGLSSIGAALWWMVIVITKSPGYGPTFPLTVAGRVITFILIILGLSFIPLVTARIASYMVTRQLREERGLEKLKNKEHTVICGWNEHIDMILDGIIARQEHAEVILVNSLAPEKMNQVLLKYKSIKPKFVHGDFTSEAILELANVKQAATVIILSDTVQGNIASADERAVLGTLAVKTMNPRARVCVEVTEPKAAPHVRRAGASEVIVHGEYDPFLITSAAMSEGIVLAARQLLSYAEKSCLQQKAIPAEFTGKRFGELAAYFREKQNALLVGLFSMGKALHAEDVLSGDYSLIDDFIERKFKEAGKEYLGAQLEIPQANLNPGDDYVIRQNEVAIVIGK